jgi:hypothetical protein
MAFRLHDIVHGLISDPFTRNEVNAPFDTKPRSIKFPDLDYPKTTSYNGLIGCENIVGNQQFADLANTLSKRISDQSKLNSCQVIQK